MRRLRSFEVLNLKFPKFRGELKYFACMKDYTSFKIGGFADLIAYPLDQEDLLVLLDEIKQKRLNFFILGNGTNLLVRDGGYQGVLISLKHLNKIRIFEESKSINNESSILSVEAGANLSKLLSFALDNNLAGCEFIVGIPGTLGGAICLNAGIPSNTIGDIVKSVTFLTPYNKFITLSNYEMKFKYRSAIIPKEHIVYEVKIELKKSNKRKIRSEIKNLINIRMKKQPYKFATAGSVFKNPPNKSAGELIESAGLKGKKIGGAQISAKHANFIINRGGAKANDVIKLIELAKKKVYNLYDIELETEIVIIGEE